MWHTSGGLTRYFNPTSTLVDDDVNVPSCKVLEGIVKGDIIIKDYSYCD